MEEGKAVGDTERRVARALARRGRRARLRASPRQQGEAGPFDLIGDIHGCLDTARALLARLGYESVDGWVHRHPKGAGPCSWATTSTGGIPWNKKSGCALSSQRKDCLSAVSRRGLATLPWRDPKIGGHRRNDSAHAAQLLVILTKVTGQHRHTEPGSGGR